MISVSNPANNSSLGNGSLMMPPSWLGFVLEGAGGAGGCGGAGGTGGKVCDSTKKI